MKHIILLFLLLPAQFVNAQTQPGLDPSFGKNGIVTDSGTAAAGLLIQPDGKIVVSGDALYRFLPSGMPDTSFGASGRAPLKGYPGIWSPHPPFGISVHLLSDGKLLVADGGNDSACVMRFTSNGQTDSSYGLNGVANAPFAELDCSVLQPDGKIILAGLRHIAPISVQLKRFTSDGKPDSSFGVNGVVLTPNGRRPGYVAGIGLMPDGRIVVGGLGGDSNAKEAAMVMRYMPDGRPDTTLNHTGQAFPWNFSYCMAMALQPDGKTLLATGWLTGSYLIRVNPDGSIDSTFGQGGLFNSPMVVTAMKLLSDGRILCSGVQSDSFAIARVQRDGSSFDSSFGLNGFIQTGIAPLGSYNHVYAMAMQPDNKLIVCGTSGRFAMLRYLPVPEGIAQVNTIDDIRVYPNPAANIINIDCSSTPFANNSYAIYSADGKVLAQAHSIHDHLVIDISCLPQGPYFLSVFSRSSSKTKLFFKQ